MNYRLTIYPAFEKGNPHIVFLFETEKEMRAASDTCANLLLFMQDQAHVMPDYSNSFIKEEKQNGEWIEIEWDTCK